MELQSSSYSAGAAPSVVVGNAYNPSVNYAGSSGYSPYYYSGLTNNQEQTQSGGMDIGGAIKNIPSGATQALNNFGTQYLGLAGGVGPSTYLVQE